MYKIEVFCLILTKLFPMKKNLLLFFIVLSFGNLLGQEGFYFVDKKEKTSIPFKIINNLLFIPIKVNGIELNFLLDSGVEETILFGLEDKKEVSFFNIEKITLRGLGSTEAIEGIKSTHNVLETHGLRSVNHLLYVVLDQESNLSSHVGIPVNGIIGYQFFRNNLVEINYQKKKIFIYSNKENRRVKIEKKFKKIPVSLERNKPYIITKIELEKTDMEAKLLVDIGNSDALWLFQNLSKEIKIPFKNYDDYLGQGFSGNIFGKRAKLARISFGDFEFKNAIVAFPDTVSIKNVRIVPGRLGSVGGEILKRFTVVFDYQDHFLYLKPNRDFKAPFLYNKSGIEIENAGLQWVKETVELQTVSKETDSMKKEGINMMNTFRYKFQLKPVYQILTVRSNSEAANVGLQKGDIILSINGVSTYKYTLQEILAILKLEEEKWVTMDVNRQGQILQFKFQLRDVL